MPGVTIESSFFDPVFDDKIVSEAPVLVDASIYDGSFFEEPAFRSDSVHPVAGGAIDHCSDGLDRLMDKLRGKTKLADYICALITPLQDIEQAALDLGAFRGVDTAVGQQLDNLGETVKESREGLSDVEYRAIIKAKGQALKSDGRANELIDILTTLDNGFSSAAVAFVPHYPAGFVMTVVVPPGRRDIGDRFARILRYAKARGVAMMLLFEQATVDLFVWSGSTGLGFQDDTNPTTTGGIWAEAI